MTLEPAPAVVFVQLDGSRFACVEAPLAAVAAPSADTATFLAPHFSLDPAHARWWSAGRAPVHCLTAAEWRRRFPPEFGSAAPLAWEPPDEARFRTGFDGLRDRLRDGRLWKGVPITRMRARIGDQEVEPLFRRLLARVPALPPGVVAYGLFLPAAAGRRAEFVIGATPELLFEIGPGGRVRTQAVAGTRKAGPGAEAALQGSAKDVAEHRAVVDHLLAEQGRWGTPRVGATRAQCFDSLVHLVTEIEVQPTAPPDFDGLLRALHPTPALGVWPRGAEGSAWLREIDPGCERRRFGAPFGIRWPSGEGRAAVAIRNLQYSEGFVEIWAGAGVVGASEYEVEWSEILDKMQAVRTLWGV
jgi:menaquinone-specific isochorismate synthase